MPSVKTKSKASVKKTKTVGSAEKKAKKKPVKKTGNRKKSKSLVVDVISDEDISELDNSNFFPDLPEEQEDINYLVKGQASEIENIDSQKKFFSDLVSEIKKKEANPLATEEENSDKRRKSIGLYRRLVFRFIVLVAVLAAAIFYFSFSSLTLKITPQGEKMSDILFLSVAKADISGDTATEVNELSDPREKVNGEIKEVLVSVEGKFSASGEEQQSKEIEGTVKIINNYSKNQPLVATTRLISPEGKLFRIKEAVDVPAGGQVQVAIYADKPSAEMELGPTTFTIPGLWLGLQDKIYATNDEGFKFRSSVKKYVNSSDIQLATKELNDSLLKKAKEEQGASSGLSNVLYQIIEPIKVEIAAKAGEFKNEFSGRAEARVIIVSFSKEEAAKFALAKLNLLVPDDKELIEFKSEDIAYTLENYNAEKGDATIKASFSGVMALKSESSIIDRSQLVNLKEAQINTYLKDFPEIKKYELKFSPSFIKKAPSLVDRIKIEVNR